MKQVLAWALVAVSASGVAGQDRALRVQTSPEYQIGGAAAEGWATLADVRVAEFGPAGELWLVDTRGRGVVRIDPGGRNGRNLLRRGGGPGEFEAPFGLAVTADGRALVGDIMSRRLQLLDADGKYSAGMPREAILGSVEYRWLRGDEFVAVPSVLLTNNGAMILTPKGSIPARELPLVRFRVNADATPDTLLRAKYNPPPRSNQSFSQHGFQSKLRWDAHNGQIAVADGPEYAVRVLDGDGRTLRTIQRGIAPRKPTRADVRAARDEARRRMIRPDGRPNVGGVSTSGTGTRANLEDVMKRIEAGLDAMTFEPVVPVVIGLKYDYEGRLWVARTADTWGEPPLLDVFAPTGVYLGTTQAFPRLPDAFGPDGSAAFIEKDEMDVPFVRVLRYRLQ